MMSSSVLVCYVIQVRSRCDRWGLPLLLLPLSCWNITEMFTEHGVQELAGCGDGLSFWDTRTDAQACSP